MAQRKWAHESAAKSRKQDELTWFWGRHNIQLTLWFFACLRYQHWLRIVFIVVAKLTEWIDRNHYRQWLRKQKNTLKRCWGKNTHSINGGNLSDSDLPISNMVHIITKLWKTNSRGWWPCWRGFHKSVQGPRPILDLVFQAAVGIIYLLHLAIIIYNRPGKPRRQMLSSSHAKGSCRFLRWKLSLFEIFLLLEFLIHHFALLTLHVLIASHFVGVDTSTLNTMDENSFQPGCPHFSPEPVYLLLHR